MRVLPAAPVSGQACGRGVSSSRHKRSPLSARCDIAWRRRPASPRHVLLHCSTDGVRTEHPWKPPRKLHSSFSSDSSGKSFFQRAGRLRIYASLLRTVAIAFGATLRPRVSIASGVTGFIRGKTNSGMGLADLKSYDGIQDCANDATSRFLSRRYRCFKFS